MPERLYVSDAVHGAETQGAIRSRVDKNLVHYLGEFQSQHHEKFTV